MHEQIAFIGTGLMGSGMAATLARKGFRVTAFSRTPARVNALAGSGVAAAQTAAEAVRGADVVISMLPHVGTLASLLDDGLEPAIAAGARLIDCSTSAPADSQAMARRLHGRGIVMLDAPVFGSKDSAETGELTFVVGGDRSSYDTCQPLFEAMGRRSFYVGGPGQGCAAKLGFNLVIAGTAQAFAEALALTGPAGVDPQLMLDIILAGRARSGIIEMKAPGMLSGDFTPFFALKHMEKDLGLMMRTAGDLHVSLPVTGAIAALYETAVARGLGELDFSAILKMVDGSAASPGRPS